MVTSGARALCLYRIGDKGHTQICIHTRKVTRAVTAMRKREGSACTCMLD